MNKSIKILILAIMIIAILFAGLLYVRNNQDKPTGVLPIEERKEISDKIDSLMK